MLISEMEGQGVQQFLELGAAFLLSAAIGLEREIRHKSAGLRTYMVVGTAAALFLLTIGMACAAGLLLLALAVTFAYFIVAFVFPRLLRLLPGGPMPTEQTKGSEHD